MSFSRSLKVKRLKSLQAQQSLLCISIQQLRKRLIAIQRQYLAKLLAIQAQSQLIIVFSSSFIYLFKSIFQPLLVKLAQSQSILRRYSDLIQLQTLDSQGDRQLFISKAFQVQNRSIIADIYIQTNCQLSQLSYKLGLYLQLQI